MQIPFLPPLNEEQYESCKKYWPIYYHPTSDSSMAYTHSQIEIESINYIFEKFLNLNENYGVFSVLFDPLSQTIIERSNEDDLTNTINHSVMQIINSFSKKRIIVNSRVEEKIESKDCLDSEILLGQKSCSSNCDYDFNDPNQYYLENLYLITFKEPCFMCAMALVHSRIKRIYYFEDNTLDGAMKSLIKINNYNLNHNYLIFKVKII
jgi:tRNA-specific adenosine deaminase 3